ncbi:MAG: hypothetical protein RL846_45805 [Deltaproteobacteria bacterium]|jgi:tetratricopeptide (TPR) repeat protein
MTIASAAVRAGAIAWGVLAVVLTVPAAVYGKNKPRRYAWVGLERGPLAPKAARQLETLLVDELDGYDRFRLVDASGHALDKRLLADDAALVSKLKNQGVDLFLRFKHKSALKKLDKAISIFESRLVTLEDYELLHDAMLAKAEAQYQSGEHGAAKATLKNLIALGPKLAPTSRTHPAKFVRLWDAAKRETGAVGRIEIECADPGCLIQVDGQRLGEAPLVATRILPGQHYVVATWPHGVLKTTVRVAAGRATQVRLERTGPAEEARRAMLEVVQRRRGAEAAEPFASRVASLARGWTTLVGAVKKGTDDRLWLFIARHGSGGPLKSVGRVPLDPVIDSERVARNVKRLCAGLFVDQRADIFSIDDDGAFTATPAVTEAMYASRSADAVDLDVSPPPPPPPGGSLVTGAVTEPPDDDDALIGQWWFWAIVGAAAVGGVVAGVVLLSPDPATTKFEVRLP